MISLKHKLLVLAIGFLQLASASAATDIYANLNTGGKFSATDGFNANVAFTKEYEFTTSSVLLSKYSGFTFDLSYVNSALEICSPTCSTQSALGFVGNFDVTISTSPVVSTLPVVSSVISTVDTSGVPSVFSIVSTEDKYDLSSGVINFLSANTTYTIKISGLSAANGGTFSLDVNAVPVLVPEPSISLSLMSCMWILGIAFKRRKVM